MPLGFSDHHSVRTVYGIDGTEHTFRNLTANVQHTDPQAQTTADINRLGLVADLFGWQEIETDHQVAALRALPGLEHFIPAFAGSYVPISWRTSVFELAGEPTSTRVHTGTAKITPARYVNSVPLRHKATGLIVTRVNTHVINGIESAGLPIDNQRRIPQAKLSLLALKAAILAGSQRGAVIWGGDLNINYLAELRLPADKRCPWFPVTALAPVTTFDMPTTGTHGKRLIDWTGHTNP